LEVVKKGLLKKYLVELECKLGLEDEAFIDLVYKTIQWYFVDYKKVEVPDNIFNTYIKELVFENLSVDNLLEKGFTIEEIVLETRKVTIDALPDLPDELLSDVSDYVRRMELNKERNVFLFLKDRLIGYIELDPLNKKDYKKAMKGTLDEDKMEEVDMNKPGEYYLYFSMIGVLRKFRNYKVLAQLTDSFMDQIVDYAKRGIIIKNMVADGYSDEGKALCKIFDMKFICNHEVAGEIYDIQMYPIDKTHNFIKRAKGLVEIYEDYRKKKEDKNIVQKILNK